MLNEESFWELWETHRDQLLRMSGCFRTSRKFKFSTNDCASQFDDFLKKFASSYFKVGGGRIRDRISSFNFILKFVDEMSPVNTGMEDTFLECFRLGLYMFISYKSTQELNGIHKMNEDKRNLPIFKEKEVIISSVINNTVTIIIGDTGCGKSTQVPQYLIEAGWNRIVCTQPRRLSTISLSERIAKEMYCEDNGDIGYQIRFESSGRGRKLKFVTEGVLLKQLQSDPLLMQYSLVIMDEVHERHISTDVLLGMLKIISRKRNDFHVIIMSATMDSEMFVSFFEKEEERKERKEKEITVNVINVPGRTYPVTINYYPVSDGTGRRRGPKEERESIYWNRSEEIDPVPYLTILKEIDSTMNVNERGDVLIFVSGLREINIIINALSEYATTSNRWVLLRLHSSLQSSEQQLIFNPTPPGVRKCIVSTNIAETSITIPNVRYVVDSGKSKELSEPSINGTTTVSLHEYFVSRSSARQRAGRAGRTGPGICYRLYSEDEYYEMIEYTTPEILRGNLDDTILLIHLLHSLSILPPTIASIKQYPLLQCPDDSTILHSLKKLNYYCALDKHFDITVLGILLSYLPLPVSHGYFLFLAACMKQPFPGVLLCASLSFESLFLSRSPQSSIEANNRNKYSNQYGDLLSNLHILMDFIRMSTKYDSVYKWCKNRMLNHNTLTNAINIITQLIMMLDSYKVITINSTKLIQM